MSLNVTVTNYDELVEEVEYLRGKLETLEADNKELEEELRIAGSQADAYKELVDTLISDCESWAKASRDASNIAHMQGDEAEDKAQQYTEEVFNEILDTILAEKKRLGL